MKIISLLILFFISANAYAWNKVGNGGDVLVCHEGSQNESVQLLDVYEGSELYGLPIQVNSEIKNDVELSLSLIERLKEITPARHQMLKTYAQNFYKETKFVSWDLEDVPDHGFLKIPIGCKVKQLIVNSCIQNSDSFFNFANGEVVSVNNENLMNWNQVCLGRFKIDKRYWDKLNITQKALSITHEAFMRDFRHMGDPEFNFDGPFHPVRYLNILLFSNKISQYNFKKFQQLYQSIGRVEQVREDSYGYIELEKNEDGPKRLKKIENGQPFWETATLITAVPNIELSLVSSVYGLDQIIPISLSKPQFYYFDDELNFSTVSQIEVYKNNYSRDLIKVTGKIRARRNNLISHPLNIDYIFDYDTNGSENLRTGFSTPDYCSSVGEDSEISPLDFLVTYTNYKENVDEEYKRIEYRTLRGLKVKNSYLDIFIDSDEIISEIRPHQKSCEEESGIADTIFVKAYGQVKIRNKWIKINNQKITIRLVKKEVEIWDQ